MDAMPAGDDLLAFLRAAPKAELHLHTIGSLRPEVVLELARRNRVSLPAETAAGLGRWVRYRDFDHFLEVYGTLAACVCTLDDLELIGYELVRDMAGQGVRYAEINFIPGAPPGTAFDAQFEALDRGRRLGEADFGIRLRWILSMPRSIPDETGRRYLADAVTELAIGYRDHGVVGVGLAGTEDGYPAEWFAPWFERALGAGLHSAPHAGEFAGPESVWGAVRALGAERIAHGVRAIEDPALVAHLAAADVALDVCPTSNVCLGVFPSMAEHPLPALLDAGVTLTIATDDPPLFGTTLTDELALVTTAYGLGRERVETLLLNGARRCFLPDGERDALVAEFQVALAGLRP
jgi:adenosine deaminase